MNQDKQIPEADNVASSGLDNLIKIDDERIKGHLDRVVRGTVEDTLNAVLDAEADRLCNAQRYERTEERRDACAGHYERKLHTNAGEVTLEGSEVAPVRPSRRPSSSATSGVRRRLKKR